MTYAPTVPTIIAIMAGGSSTRMGTDKATLRFGGVTLLERIATEALATGCSVIVVGRPAPAGWPFDQIKFIPDLEPNAGPLAGIVAALTYSEKSAVLAVAADMPLMTRDSFAWLLAQSNRDVNGDGVIVQNQGQIEPLFSVYFPKSLPRASDQVAQGRRSIQQFIQSGNYQIVDAPPSIAESLVNINTPEEFERLLALGSH